MRLVGLRKIVPFFLQAAKQRPEADEGVAAPRPVQGGEDGEDVVAGDLA
jgi:hypothetical protein